MTTLLQGDPGEKPPLILIVDDVPENLQAAGKLLENHGFDLILATDGLEAIDCAEEENPDLILLDVMMPQIDGYSVCRALKDGSRTANIPVIFLTAKFEDEDVVAGFRAGGVDFISKPFREEELVARVTTHVALAQERNRIREIKKLLQKQARTIKRQNEEVLRHNAELKRMHELKNEFLGIAAHDLKNPLAAITGMVQIALDDEIERERKGQAIDEELHEILSTVHESSMHMQGIVEDLLNTQALESDNIELQKDIQNLDELARSVVNLNGKQAEAKQISVELLIEEEIALKIDGRRIYEAMDNYVSNAIKFSPKGKRVTVSLARVSEDKPVVDFSVRDEGPGVSEKDQEKLFGQFQKLSARPTGGESSTGLGLSIVKRIIELHCGRVWFENRKEGGAAFHFTLPVGSD